MVFFLGLFRLVSTSLIEFLRVSPFHSVASGEMEQIMLPLSDYFMIPSVYSSGDMAAGIFSLNCRRMSLVQPIVSNNGVCKARIHNNYVNLLFICTLMATAIYNQQRTMN